jgi:hypothetical protein
LRTLTPPQLAVVGRLHRPRTSGSHLADLTDGIDGRTGGHPIQPGFSASLVIPRTSASSRTPPSSYLPPSAYAISPHGGSDLVGDITITSPRAATLTDPSRGFPLVRCPSSGGFSSLGRHEHCIVGATPSLRGAASFLQCTVSVCWNKARSVSPASPSGQRLEGPCWGLFDIKYLWLTVLGRNASSKSLPSGVADLETPSFATKVAPKCSSSIHYSLFVAQLSLTHIEQTAAVSGACHKLVAQAFGPALRRCAAVLSWDASGALPH